MFKQLQTIFATLALTTTTVFLLAQARPVEDEFVATIPSPYQEFNDEFSSMANQEIQRTSVYSARRQKHEAQQGEPSNEASIPVYVSPFARAELADATVGPANFEARQESRHAPANYAPRPGSDAADLKTSASYGHHHDHHAGYHGYEPSGWLDMGAWTGGKGSFGWYADYPVGGGKQHYGYGR